MDENLPPLGTPPPINPPPPFVSPPPPLIAVPTAALRPRTTGRGWKILCLLLLIALGLSLFRHLAPGFGSGRKAVPQGEPRLDEIVVQDNGAQQKILIVEVEGIIASAPLGRSGRSLVDSIQDQLKSAARDENVRAVILKVNSPGGEVLASDEIYNLIRDFQNTHKKPVIASMGSLAASGGYYISAPCRWIVANEMTLTGSIGVIMHGYNYRGLMDKIGIRPDVYKSGKHKNMLSGDRKEEEIPDDEREMIQALIMETYGKFTNVVATGRDEANSLNKGKGHALAADWTEYADGRVVSGKQALELGLVDELGNFKKAVTRAQDLGGTGKANLIRYEEPFNMGNFFKLFGKSDVPATTLKVDLGMDLPKLQIGRLYFIAPTTLP
ncbi:MAG: signal peptide peptidase SppA [Verrucomicrobiota bacterium]